MRNARVSSRDVASAAGVSISTVSLVVRGSPLVKDATRKRVQEVIDRLGYTSHAAAAALRSARANTIGYIAPRLSEAADDVFRHQMISAITTCANAADYHVLVDNFLSVQHHAALFSSGRIDGAIVDWAIGDEGVQELQTRGVPFVLVGRDTGNPSISLVKADERGGSYEAVRHLISLGHRRIALLREDGTDLAGAVIAEERVAGYWRAITEAGLDIDPAYIVQGNWSYASGFVHGQRLLSQPTRPTAVFALSELIALGVLKAARSLHLRVPEDVSVVTTEDTPWVEYVWPELTAAHIPMYEVGTRATELVLAHLDDPDLPPQQLVLPTTLVIRESSAPPYTLA